MWHAESLLAKSTPPTLENCSLSLTTYPGEPDERSTKNRFIMASPAGVGKLVAIRPVLSIPEQHLAAKAGEDVDYVAMPKASHKRSRVLMYLQKVGYDIKLVDNEGFARAMSQVKWSIPNPSGSTDVDLFGGPPTDLLCHVVKDFQSLYAIKPILSFLKDMLVKDPQLPSQNSSTTTTRRAPTKGLPR
ncbi:La-related protein 6 [Hordeum vulgare]|nr:La-related protein 6 [Hordeum vulgare]